MRRQGGATRRRAAYLALGRAYEKNVAHAQQPLGREPKCRSGGR